MNPGFDLLFHQFFAYTLAGLTAGGIYVMVAMGYTLIYRVLRVLDLSYAAVLMAGTFAAWFIQKQIAGNVGPIVSVCIVVLGAVICCILIELLIEGLVVHQLVSRGASLLGVIVASLGVFFVIQESLNHWQGPLPVSFTLPFRARSLVSIGTGDITNTLVIVVVGVILSVLLVALWSRKTRIGKTMEAVAQDRDAASLVGVNVHSTERATFIVVGVLAGIGAVLYLFTYTSTSYEVGLPLAVIGLSAAVVGGMGNIFGAALGGLVLGLLESYGTALFGATWHDSIGYVVLIILVLARPEGLLPERTAEVRA